MAPVIRNTLLYGVLVRRRSEADPMEIALNYPREGRHTGSVRLRSGNPVDDGTRSTSGHVTGWGG